MREDKRLVFFSSPSTEGQELVKAVQKLAVKHGLEFAQYPTRDILRHFGIQWTTQVVIYDSSLEEGGELSPSFYPIRPIFNHELIVSRTYLPENLEIQRPGGAPPYPFPFTTTENGNTLPGFEDFRWGNDQIVRWLDEQLVDPDLRGSRRMSVDEANALLRKDRDNLPIEEIFESIVKIQGKELFKRRQEYKRDRIFVSYRGSHFRDVLCAIEGFKKRQQATQEKKDFVYFRPGELALENELLTEARRWQLYARLVESLQSCDELWIFESEDYLQSWWTLGELVAVAYVNGKRRKRDPIEEAVEYDEGGGRKRTRKSPIVVRRISLDKRGSHFARSLDVSVEWAVQKELAFLIKSSTGKNQGGPRAGCLPFLGRAFSRSSLAWYWGFRILRPFAIKHLPNLVGSGLRIAATLGVKFKFTEKSILEKSRNLLDDMDLWRLAQESAARGRHRARSRAFWRNLTVEPELITNQVLDYPLDSSFFLTSPSKRCVGPVNMESLPKNETSKVPFRGVETEVVVSSIPPRYTQAKIRYGQIHGSRYGLRPADVWVVDST